MERIIFNNYDFNEEDIINSILEMNEELTKEDITTEMIYDEWCWQEQVWFEDVFSELKSFFNNNKVICFGNIGRWNGYFDCGKIFDDFETAWYSMTKDCDYVKIYEKNNHFYIDCSHHDGNNHFEVKVLTDKAIEYYDNWNYGCWIGDKRSEADVHTQIIKRYSKMPRYCKSMWG